MPKQRSRCLGFLMAYAFTLATLALSLTAAAEDPRSGPAIPQATPYDISETQARACIQWLAELAIRSAPRTFDGDKDWGETKSVFSGIKLDRDGLRLKASRRKKDVRHGRWIKYELTLPQASHPGSDVPDGITTKILQVTQAAAGQPGNAIAETPTFWKIDSSIETPMKFTARIERWNRGVQWYSISIKGKLRIRIDATTRLAFLTDYAEIPPALIIAPRIESSKLHLEKFEVDRISKIGGDVAEEWGELLEQTLLDVFIKKQNAKLTSKLNKSIEKHEDDLRLSIADWFATGWK